ncbi:hypothetical protein MKK75_23020 [Methylobacterium sp. J-030]|uniref:hypothetical protein n=1 Tax=Methylobacterium sp. J-030 TaxID=2836627 RepID=UPI001FB888CA|nr:hypothetical protein [Methylobacterium sp. J-030]MCJ2071636.1 hypothetical protein [Methylobacterium sp. J-030]
MRNYRLCAAYRAPDGLLSTPVYEETITAKDVADAVAQAKATELDMAGLKANAIYLINADGHVAWSLRIAEVADDVA